MINNLITVFYMLGLLGIIITINTTLGIIIANKNLNFQWDKFWKGLGKAVAITICILLFCLTLELVPVILGQVGIDIPSDLITTLEIVLTTFTAYKKYALDCFDKFKTIIGGE